MTDTFTNFLYLLITLFLDFRFQVLIVLLVLSRWIFHFPRTRKTADGKSVFITGCDSGMGHRMARRFDELGMRVFAGCLQPDGNGATSLMESCSDRLHIVPLDITSEEQVREAVSYVRAHLLSGEKGLYCLINNAGVLCFTEFELMTQRMIEDCINVNLIGTMRVTKHFLPLLSHIPGRIVTVTSILARLVCPLVSVYAATKHGLDGFFSSLRQEVEERGIRISTVEPGDFSSCTDIFQYTRRHIDEMWDNLSPEEKETKREMVEKIKRNVFVDKCPEFEQEKHFKILLADVEDATLAEEPKWRYVSAPFATKVALSVMRNLPGRITHKLMARR